VAELEAQFDALVRDVVVPVLKPLGYAKSALRWTRRAAEAVYLIGLQRSDGNGPGHLRFYVNVGAYVPKFAHVIGKPVIDAPKEPDCHWRARLEKVTGWAVDCVDVEAWSGGAPSGLGQALAEADAVLAGIDGAAALVRMLDTPPLFGGLNLDLFAYRCATGDIDGASRQVDAASVRFGAEPRWVRLQALFDQTAAKFGIVL